LRDARRTGDGWQLLLLGQGEIPVKDALRLLTARGYEEFISVEWEKKWHPGARGARSCLPAAH